MLARQVKPDVRSPQFVQEMHVCWLQGCRRSRTNGVFGKWLQLLSLTLGCYCTVPPAPPPLLISHSADRLHMAQSLPPTPRLSGSRSHTRCSRALCVCVHENKRSTFFLTLPDVRESTTQAFSVKARNAERRIVQMCSRMVESSHFIVYCCNNAFPSSVNRLRDVI